MALKQVLRRWLPKLRWPPRDLRRWKGHHGEWLAKRYLKHMGLDVFGHQIKTPYGEIDLVARDGDTWVFIEVKTRSTPLEDLDLRRLVPRRQSLRIRRAARHFLRNRRQAWAPYRYDLIVVTLTESRRPIIRWIPNIWTVE